MKITKARLKQIIKEELENIKENYTKIGMREVTAEAKRKIKEEGTISLEDLSYYLLQYFTQFLDDEHFDWLEETVADVLESKSLDKYFDFDTDTFSMQG